MDEARTGGYVLTNGIVSICEDRDENWIEHLLADLHSVFKDSWLFATDEVSRTQWIKEKGNLKCNDPMSKMTAILLSSKSNTIRLSTFCEDSNNDYVRVARRDGNGFAISIKKLKKSKYICFSREYYGDIRNRFNNSIETMSNLLKAEDYIN